VGTPAIVFNGNRYVLRAPIVLQGITEFNTAVRQGSPSNDDRNLASFFSYEDARGGIGVKQGSVREDPDKLADHDGLIAWKFNELIKPPDMQVASLSGATKGLSATATIHEMDVDNTIRIYMGFGDQLWYSNGSTAALTRTSADPYTTQDITDMMVYVDPTGGTKRCYVANGDGADIRYFTDPTAGSPFTTVTNLAGEMFFEFDGKMFLGGPGTLEWSINPSNNAAWTSLTAVGAWPNRWKFIGVFAFGDTFMPYVLIHHNDPTRARIAVVDVDSNKVYPLSLETTGILEAFPHSGGILVIHDSGRDVLFYDPFSRDRRELDWRATLRDGFLAARDGAAVGGDGHHDGPMVLSNHTATTETQLFQHRATGWQPYGIEIAGDGIASPRYIDHLNQWVIPVKPAGTDLQLNFIDWWDEAFTPGVDQTHNFEDSDVKAITPWFALGFQELVGPLLGMSCAGFFDSSNKILVEYQTDLDEVSAYTTLGTFPGTVASTPEIVGRSRAVAQDDFILFNSLVGVAAQWVRFRFTLKNSVGVSKPKQSPNAYPLILRFFKRPDLRESFRLEIDVGGTLSGREDLTTVDDLWQELKAIYDLQTVPTLVAGSISTWAVMIGFPRVIQFSEASADDINPNPVAQDATIVVNVAELL
jgi:hypothetical protein